MPRLTLTVAVQPAPDAAAETVLEVDLADAAGWLEQPSERPLSWHWEPPPGGSVVLTLNLADTP